jgi:hypothetical protein
MIPGPVQKRLPFSIKSVSGVKLFCLFQHLFQIHIEQNPSFFNVQHKRNYRTPLLPKGTQPQNIPSAIAFGQPSWGKITK